MKFITLISLAGLSLMLGAQPLCATGWKPTITATPKKKEPQKAIQKTAAKKKPVAKSAPASPAKTAKAPAPAPTPIVLNPQQTQVALPPPVAKPRPAARTTSAVGVDHSGQNLNEAQVSRNRALSFMKLKNYAKARGAAQAYTELAPQDPEAWLMLGVILQKSNDPLGAKEAYERHLALQPSSARAGAIRQRVAELAIIERQDEIDQALLKRYRYNGDNWGLFFAYSPVFTPDSVTELTSDALQSFSLGFRVDQAFYMGLRYAKGSVGRTQVPSGGFETGGDYMLLEPFFEPTISYNKPYKKLSIVQVYSPVHVGVPYNRVSLAGKSYSNWGVSIGTGLGLRFYTTTFLVIETTGMYHFGFPLSGIRENGVDPPLRTTSGASIQGRMSGLDVRVMLTFLFF